MPSGKRIAKKKTVPARRKPARKAASKTARRKAPKPPPPKLTYSETLAFAMVGVVLIPLLAFLGLGAAVKEYGAPAAAAAVSSPATVTLLPPAPPKVLPLEGMSTTGDAEDIAGVMDGYRRNAGLKPRPLPPRTEREKQLLAAAGLPTARP